LKFIFNNNDYIEFLQKNNDKLVMIPIFSYSEKHYCINRISIIYIKNLLTNEEYIISKNHSEFKFDVDLAKIKSKEIWTINYKHLYHYFNNENIIDANLFAYLNGETVNFEKELNIHRYFNHKFDNDNINDIIPISKHIELCQINCSQIIRIMKLDIPSSLYVYQLFLKDSYVIENSGIKINRDIFNNFFKHNIDIGIDDIVYSEYNFFTSTGRPSNHFGGINFSSLNKKNGSRKSFIPRNNCFIMFDYDSYHFNILSKIINYKIETSNIHQYLARYYGITTKLTDIEYEKIKAKNFNYLYGGVPEDILDKIPFFKKINDFTIKLWDDFQNKKYFESPLTFRKIYNSTNANMNPNKILSYFIQLLETEINFMIIHDLIKILKNKKTKLILYTYDAFLFDYSFEDNIITEIKKIINKFPSKIYIGNNYNDMKQIKSEEKIL